MTPRQARLALGAFSLLAAGVTGNALYLQGSPDQVAAKPAAAPPLRAEPQRQPSRPAEIKAGRKPAQQNAVAPPKIAEHKDAEQHKTAEQHRTAEQHKAAESSKDARALKVRTVRVATIGEAPPEEADTETVRAVQAELNRRGHGPVQADGVMRAPTRAAIMAFQQEHRLPLTGEATQELLKLLLFGAPAAAGTAGPVEVRSPQVQALVKDVQRQLAARGYRPGAIDGRLSAETVAAIRTFETDQGLVPKGRISAAVLARLESGMGGGGRHKDP